MSDPSPGPIQPKRERRLFWASGVFYLLIAFEFFTSAIHNPHPFGTTIQTYKFRFSKVMIHSDKQRQLSMKRLLPPVFLVLCVVAMGLSHLFLPIAQIFSWPASASGAIPVLLGLTIASAGAKQFTREGTNIKTFDDPDKLVTEGLFAHSRNPMYLGFALAAFGAAIVFGSLSSFAIAVIHLVVLDRWYIEFEEQRMTLRFGEEYRTYKKRVRRWV